LDIGGSSYAAVAAVYVTLQAPGRFGKLLAESIVSWVGNGQLVRDCTNIVEAPERAWLGIGGRRKRPRNGLRSMNARLPRSRLLARNSFRFARHSWTIAHHHYQQRGNRGLPAERLRRSCLQAPVLIQPAVIILSTMSFAADTQRFQEITIDLPEARLWIVSVWPTTYQLAN
jgi:hypothetical protein